MIRTLFPSFTLVRRNLKHSGSTQPLSINLDYVAVPHFPADNGNKEEGKSVLHSRYQAQTNWIGRDCERKQIYYEEWMFEEATAELGLGSLWRLPFNSDIKLRETLFSAHLKALKIGISLLKKLKFCTGRLKWLIVSYPRNKQHSIAQNNFIASKSLHSRYELHVPHEYFN